MSVILDQWTGNGLADGTALTSGNIATAGNFTGSDVTWAVGGPTGSPTFETLEDGFKIIATTDTAVVRLDSTLTATAALRMQAVFTPMGASSGANEMMIIRNGTATVCYLRFDGSTRIFTLRDNANTTDYGTSPAITLGDEMVIDIVVALHAAPTTSNGRMFYRLTNMTDLGWNTTGYHFFDSLYVRNLLTANFTQARWGKTGGIFTLSSPGCKWEFCGVEGITVDPADTSEQDASAYFADNPSAPYFLEAGSVASLVTGYRLG